MPQPTEIDVDSPAPRAGWLLRAAEFFLARGFAISLLVITMSTIAVSQGVAAVVFRWAELSADTQRAGFLVAFAVPAIVAPIYSFFVLLLLRELAHAREVAQRLMVTDDLTRTATRRHFLSLAAAEMARAQRHRTPLSLVVLDVDQFKQVNDRRGHAAGDAALKLVADACRRELRTNDILARLGGDEFAVLLPQTALDGAVSVAERLRAAVIQAAARNPALVEPLTISAGVAEWGNSMGGAFDQVLEAADQALYVAKAAGRNCVRSAVSA